MSLKAAELDRAWGKLGFDIYPEKRDITARLWVDGKMILSTRRSHGSGKLDGNIPHLIRQQMRLNADQFRDAIACPLTREQYLEILRQKELIPK